MGEGSAVFSLRARRWGHVWIGATAAGAVLLGTLVDGERAYLLAWILVGCLLVFPATALGWIACTRAPTADRRFWQLFTGGLGLIIAVGLLILGRALVPFDPVFELVGAVLVAVCAALFFASLIELIRTRSTLAVSALDVLESAMLVIALCAFPPLAWGNRPIVTASLWFAVPTVLATIAVLAGFCLSIAMFRRIDGKVMPDETLGLAIGVACTANTTAQVGQAFTGFGLPAPLLLACQALCFGVVLLIPLHLSTNTPRAFDTLPALDQTRTRALDTLAIALLVPLLGATILLRPTVDWAVWYFIAIASVLLVLAVVRGKLAIRETRRLYRSVEDAAASRQRLLADVLRTADQDRHRVAAQLHQQATASFVAFKTLCRDDGMPASLTYVRDDLEGQVDALRDLMLAIRPLDTNDNGSADLRSILAAYIDSLYADATPPSVDIRIDEDLELDWTTETILMRILQEALRNARRHAHATHLIVSIDVEDAGVAARVLDDGVGFDPRTLVYESGTRYMREFAAHVGGHVEIESTPGEGTTVRAVLGTGMLPTDRTTADRAASRATHLRLVAGDADDPPSDAASESIDLRVGEPAGEHGSATSGHRRTPFADVQARIAQRRATSDGRRFFYFKFPASEAVVKDVLRACAAAFLALPLALGVVFTISPRGDAARWLAVSTLLFIVVLLTLARDVRHLRRQAWDRFDPRMLFAQELLALLATGAFGVATGGDVALFGPILLIQLVIAVIACSRLMILTLWGLAVAVVAAVLALTQADPSVAIWTVLFFAFSTGLVAGIVDLTVWNARNGLRSLEAVADFTSFACGVRAWDADAAEALRKIAAAVEARTVMVYERRPSGPAALREIGRWSGERALSPFVESELRQLAERAEADGTFEIASRSSRGTRLLAIAAGGTSSDIVLAVEVGRVGQRLDAALIAAVASLVSVIDRTNLIEQLVGEARTDSLTGLANRRQLHDYVAHAVGAAHRRHEPLTVAMIDLDHFKDFNDRFGHAAGDEVLRQFSARLRARLRAQDIAARYGGEEFCVVLPSTTAADAEHVLDDLRSEIEQYEGERVTFSAGVAQLDADGTGEGVLAAADAALYRAKRAGRDQTHVCEPGARTDDADADGAARAVTLASVPPRP